MLKDGHIHTKYCPHGTADSFSEYIEKAIKLGFQEITFTEHAPLPEQFEDPAPGKDSAMNPELLDAYFADLDVLKKKFAGVIKINTGLEVDFIEGYEEETRRFLDKVGPKLDDAILSVHFLKYRDNYDCLDYSPEVFGQMIEKYGTIEALYERYFDTLLLSIKANLGRYKPTRIGHITLVRKFHKKFPAAYDYSERLAEILLVLKIYDYALDYNGAGTAKPLCREPYPPDWIAEKAVELGIPLVYGSDAHQAKELGQGREQMAFIQHPE
ncbi:histidinol-phosphatase HisJ [Bacillus canaveralius]|uniref:histidinol-phosphatase HisJ n=1 Tax=Bacillus canaveralius TaxID=1403243 RepID=UPI000F7AE89A|nr:histidinol-phosphatase HisJ [Bacillus canaveralius]RSK48227.1 histidinol-phosphatase HisJ [Bacillus canaveralius]